MKYDKLIFLLFLFLVCCVAIVGTAFTEYNKPAKECTNQYEIEGCEYSMRSIHMQLFICEKELQNCLDEE
jgi:hypothetical protein